MQPLRLYSCSLARTPQDYPLKIWADDHIDEFLHEMLRKEGLGPHRGRAQCGTCKAALTIPPTCHDYPPSPPPAPLLRCRDCFGDCVECLDCCLHRHARLPLHCTEVCTVLKLVVCICSTTCLSGMDWRLLAQEDVAATRPCCAARASRHSVLQPRHSPRPHGC